MSRSIAGKAWEVPRCHCLLQGPLLLYRESAWLMPAFALLSAAVSFAEGLRLPGAASGGAPGRKDGAVQVARQQL